ncbi:glycoside hydrolase family 13 protein [candidate division KSB1 bacterium]|nr:glycoside hydrolase family 13 protein [candidate division KSB1 bacterium]
MKNKIKFMLCAVLFSSLLFSCDNAKINKNEPVYVPEWAQGAVWYQIFPERFRNGSEKNDPTKTEIRRGNAGDWRVTPWTSDWYAMADWEKAKSDKFYDGVFDRRYGGDLIGVTEKLDYLVELGVTAIYFNPIFEAYSLHKYDAESYHHIDNNFGRDRDGDRKLMESETKNAEHWAWSSADSVFLELIAAAHERGLRVIIDGVFNHVGREFWAFQDVLQNGEKSKYADWFTIYQFDDPDTPEDEMKYASWWNSWFLVEFREDENGLVEPVRKHIWAITKRWMDPNGDGDPADGIDGWRLDVVPDVAMPFWADWGAYVRELNPDAYIVGEVWEEASQYIANDKFHAVMNYPFARLAVNFFIDKKEKKINASQFAAKLDTLLQVYPRQVMLGMQNLIDSHDTDRLASMIKNPDRPYDHDAGPRSNKNYDVTKPTEIERKVQLMIAAFQCVFPGAPMIYYGDEAGMWGADDPDDRKPMPWPEFKYDDETYTALGIQADPAKVGFDHKLFAEYKAIFNLRKQHTALKTGQYQIVLTDDERELFGLKRWQEGDMVYAYFNNGEKPQTMTLPLEARRLKDALEHSVTTTDSTFILKAKSAAIFVR